MMDAFADRETIEHGAGLDQEMGHRSPSLRQAIGEPWRQAGVADALRRGLYVIGHAAIGDLARSCIEGEETGRGIAVARLADGAGHYKPLPALEQLYGNARSRHKAGHLGGDRHRIERRLVDVAAEGDLRGR